MNVDAFTSAMLGIAFVVLGTVTTFLMFWLWGFPYDKTTRTSAAPKSLMVTHRVLGFAFVGLYVFMMTQMVPRLTSYQVEFPARTVVHICLGVTIGFLLILKISIIRFFRHLEEWMPFLGVGILLCTYLLAALSVPFTMRERQLSQRAAGGDAFSDANLARVAEQLPSAGLPPEAKLDELATRKSLMEGRRVLLTKCVDCHDLRTVLTRPRSPADWAKTVDRMSDRNVLGQEITQREQWEVTAYLVAISPVLQNAAAAAREKKVADEKRKSAAKSAGADDETMPAYKKDDVQPTYERLCTQCHELDDVESHAWTDSKDLKDVLERMVDNGLEAEPDELRAIEWLLNEKYVKK